MEEFTMTTAEIIEVIKGLTVLELNDLVKACEEEFGVSAAARVLVNFAKGAEALEVKGGVVDGVYYDADGVKQIASIPSREVLLSKLLGSMQSPITNFARVIKQIAEQNEEAAQ